MYQLHSAIGQDQRQLFLYKITIPALASQNPTMYVISGRFLRLDIIFLIVFHLTAVLKVLFFKIFIKSILEYLLNVYLCVIYVYIIICINTF